MNREDIMMMVKEAGPLIKTPFDKWCERFAELVAEHEREMCAKVCENDRLLHYDPVDTQNNIAAAIRARGASVKQQSLRSK